MERWKWTKVFFKVLAAVLAFVAFVGTIEWATVKQRDWDIWMLSHRAEEWFEKGADQ